MEREDPSSTRSGAVPRPLCLPSCFIQPNARGAEAALEGRAASVVQLLGLSSVLLLRPPVSKMCRRGGVRAAFGRSGWLGEFEWEA